MREIIGLPGSDVFALTDSTGAVYAWDCTGGDKRLFRSEGNVSGVTLTRMQRDQGGMPLLGFLDDNQPRCFARREKVWSFARCSPVHLLSVSVPRQDGAHLTVGLGNVAAMQTFPIEMFASQDRRYQARRAGSTVVRWESPTTAAKQFAEKLRKAWRRPAFRQAPAMADEKW